MARKKNIDNVINYEDNERNLSRNISEMKRRINGKKKKLDVIFLELSCCTGESIVFLNASVPDAEYFLKEMINLKFSHVFDLNDGTFAYDDFEKAVETGGYVLLLGGAIPTYEGGNFCILGMKDGKYITAEDIALVALKNAKLVLNTGTCSCYGGISAAAPNPTGCISIPELMRRKRIEVPYINIPGCPTKNEWVLGTISHIIEYGIPELDEDRRPLMYFGETIHDHCQRRGYFDSGIFATKMGDHECYYKLGCLGPITKANCSTSGWNGTNNWPVANNSPCIGCTYHGFPDKIESFIKEEKDLHGYKKRD